MYLRQQWILMAYKDILIALFSPGYPFTTPIFLHRAAAPRSVSLFLLSTKNSIVLYYLSKEARNTLCLKAVSKI